MTIIKMFLKHLDYLVICVMVCEYHFCIIITEQSDRKSV